MSRMNEKDEREEDNPLRLNLESKFKEDAEYLSEYFGISSKTELFRFIIKREVRMAKTLSFFEEILEIKELKEKVMRIISLLIKTLKEEL